MPATSSKFPAPVAQIFNLPYRRFAIGSAPECGRPSKFQRPADCKSAIQQNVILRYAALLFLFLALGLQNIFAQRPLGTDVSGHQPVINWQATKNPGVAFAWAKATESTTYTSPYFNSQVNNARAVGIYIGAYHFARPSANPNLTGANSADSEANYFWNVVSSYIKPTGPYLVPMLDWEDDHATNGTGLTVTQMSQWVNQWCNTVSNLAQANGVTLKPVIYTGVWFSQPSGGGLGYPGLNTSVTGWPNWISAYNGQNPQTGGPTSTYPWSTWNIWQYKDTNWSGGDSDVFKGTLAQFADLFIIGGVGLPQPNVVQRAADAGNNVSFNFNAAGTGIKFQWRFNGTNLPGVTTATLALANVQTNNSGLYSVVVTNAAGTLTVTSKPVSLLVYPPQATLFADNFDANTATNWIQNKSSADTAVNFNFDYSTAGIPSAPNSTNGSTSGVQLQANLSAGAVAAVSISPTNKIFSGDYRLRFDAWINVNGPLPGGGGSTEFLTAGLGTSGTRAEWTGNASADGHYFSANGDGGSSDTATVTADYNAYSSATVLAAGTGVYWAGTDTSARGNTNAYYTTVFSNTPAAPAAQLAGYPLQTGSVTNGTFGMAWHDVIVSRRGSTVDWVVDGARFATISNATFTASNVFVGFWDPFSSLSANNDMNFGLVDNVRVESPAVAPVFTLQPFAQTVKLGTNVTFAAAATGLPSPNFQWRFNGTNILGATNSTYALAFVAQTNAGNYSVIASNFMAAVTSTNAALSLTAPAAAQFTAINANSGAVQITFTGDAYWTYTIETSTNLTSWSTLTNLTSANGVFNFTAGSSASAQQFFRARAGP
jgi:GH25 family lysozyme M1 (1,4-beta-N-acetylmuramidase)